MRQRAVSSSAECATHLGLKCEQSETGEYAQSDEQRLEHDTTLVVTRHGANHHRLEYREQTQQDQVCRMLMSLPIHSKQTRKTPQHGNPNDPCVFVHEIRRGGYGHGQRDERGGEELDEQDGIDFPDESESDSGITVDHGHTDFEVVWKIIRSWLVHPCVPTGAGG